MSEFTIRSESVDVEQIMKQIRQRILEKRGADYTEDQVRELATVRLEKFLDPKNLRSDLLDQFRKSRPAVNAGPPTIDPPYTFDDQTLFASHRGPLRLARKLLFPVLKLFFNPNTLNQVLHAQAQFNVDLLKREARRKIEFDKSRAEWNALYYEVLHNLVLETTRVGIEVQNLRMRVESLSSRLDFSERRVRALEGVVQYRPEAVRPRERREPAEPAIAQSTGSNSTEGFVPTGGPSSQLGPGSQSSGTGDASGKRRRRRRRGRRGADDQGQPGSGGPGSIGVAGGQGDGTPQEADTAGETFDDDNESFDGGDDLPAHDAGADAGPMDAPAKASDDDNQ